MDFETMKSLVAEHGTPTLFLSASRVRESYRSLTAALPGVELFYAVKSNSDPSLVQILSDEGSSFDVCTNGEIRIVEECGVTGSRCLHTHPIKQEHEIARALDFGIRLFVVENPAELDKMVRYKDRAQVLVRVAVQNPSSLVNLSYKFGAAPQDALPLIRKAAELGITVRGISFHTGSQNENNLKYIEALDYCRDICRMAALSGVSLDIIDIGGGFPISYISGAPQPAEFCLPINEYLGRFFANYRIIAEPGRFISGPAVTLACRVIGRSVRNGMRWYYLDDGLYGSFSGKMYDHADYPMAPARQGKKYNSVLAGPTCDSIDVLYENIALPELEIGEILLFGSMGAYTSASASNFNGYDKPKIVVVD